MGFPACDTGYVEWAKGRSGVGVKQRCMRSRTMKEGRKEERMGQDAMGVACMMLHDYPCISSICELLPLATRTMRYGKES